MLDLIICLTQKGEAISSRVGMKWIARVGKIFIHRKVKQLIFIRRKNRNKDNNPFADPRPKAPGEPIVVSAMIMEERNG